MSPVLTLVLAATLSNADPTREQAALLVAAIELHASIDLAAADGGPAPAAADATLWYDAAAGAAIDASAPDRPDARTRITYTLTSPIFRDSL